MSLVANGDCSRKETNVARIPVRLPACHIRVPAKAVGRNEMPFGRDTCVVPSNVVLDKVPSLPTGRGDLGSEPPVRSDAAYCQITSVRVTVRITRTEQQYSNQLTVENKCTPTTHSIAKLATRKRDRINRNMTRVMEAFFMPTRCTSSFHNLSALHLQTLHYQQLLPSRTASSHFNPIDRCKSV